MRSNRIGLVILTAEVHDVHGPCSGMGKVNIPSVVMSTSNGLRWKSVEPIIGAAAILLTAACGSRTGLDNLTDSTNAAGLGGLAGNAGGIGGGGNTGDSRGSGGAAIGGAATGGRVSAQGGTAVGGRNSVLGGSSTGGRTVASGGTATGGHLPAVGGRATGGAISASGGNATGGTIMPIGGSATGGTPLGIGGIATGGRFVATGGTATGGRSTVNGGSSSGGNVPVLGGRDTGGRSASSGGNATGGLVIQTGGFGIGGSVAGGTLGTGGLATGGMPTAGSPGTGGSHTGGTTNDCREIRAVPGTAAVVDFAAVKAATPDNHAFFDAPWPELARSVSELANFPNPRDARGCSIPTSDPLAQLIVNGIDPWQYRAYMNHLASQWLASGPNSGSIYIRFDGPLDASRFPTPLDSLDTKASPLVLLRVDGKSASRGRAVPVLTRVFERSLYLEPHTLSVLPHPGFPLEPDALYALVIRRRLGDALGQPLGSPAWVEQSKQSTRCLGDPAYDKVFDLLQAEFGIRRADVAVMTVFRSGSPAAELGAVIPAADRLDPKPFGGLSVGRAIVDETAGYVLVDGTFETVIHQFGSPPYLPPVRVRPVQGVPTLGIDFDPTSEQGRFLAEPPPLAPGATDTGHPRTERIAFRLGLPLGARDANGKFERLAVAIYGPGTGGSVDTPFADGTASLLARSNIATFCATPVMHQARAHAENIDPRLLRALALLDRLTGRQTRQELLDLVQSGNLFFNPLNLQAAKGNSLQAALDYAFQAHLLSQVNLEVSVNDAIQNVSFDPTKVFFMGHSQGAATGPLLAHSDTISTMFLSAPTGHLITNLLGKTKPSAPIDPPSAVSFIVCDDPGEPLDIHHPQLNLLEHWFESADAANYAPLLIWEAPGLAKHVFIATGTDDHYVTPPSHDAVTTAARLHGLAPGLRFVAGQRLLAALFGGQGYDAVYPALSGNLAVGGRAITGAFGQYHEENCSDDHFVYQCNAVAVTDWSTFLSTALRNSPPLVGGL